MSEATGKPYTIVGIPVQQNKWNEVLQKVESGWTVQAQWHVNGAIITVFVPAGVDLATTADALIQEQGQQLNALYAL